MEDRHFPGQEEAPAPEAPQVPPAPAPEAPAPEAKPEDQQPAPEAPKAEAPAPEAPPTKKRSIYDDLKDTRQEKNDLRDVAIAALQAQGIELKGDETVEQLKSLLEQRKAAPPAPKPEAPAPSAPDTPPAKPADPLEAFAQEEGLDPAQLKRLTEIIAGSIPRSELSAEERETLKSLTDYKNKAEAAEQRRSEDATILAEAPSIKTQLAIHDDAELAAVMAEVTRLAHTPEFADKEVSYIVWKKQAELSKLVSPKKPSFETGDLGTDPAPEAEPDLSKGNVTPEAVQRAVTRTRAPALEVRKQK